MAADPALWGIVVTYRRSSTLAPLVDELRSQTRPPDHILVIDNGSQIEVAEACLERGVHYVNAGENLGPAGGFALGMRRVSSWAHPRDWMVLVDDDDPPGRPDLIETLLSFGERQLAADPATGGVGRVGSRYDKRTGRMLRLPDEALSGPVSVDTIGGNQFPHYRVSAVAVVGGYDDRLFFGFEELEFGLRMRRAGYSLYAHGDLWVQSRKRSGRLNLDSSQLRTPPNTAAWRRYYTARNATWIARRYGRPSSAFGVGARSGLGGTARLLQTHRSFREAVLPMQGVRDAFVGQLGRTIDPGAAPKTHTR